METPLETAIRKIVSEVPKGRIFDSHFVMNELVKRFSDQYLSFAGRFAGGEDQRTLAAHGQIGKRINKLDGTVIQRIGKGWSENLHKKPSPCTCWKKL
jgi:hypothetical protein